MPEFEKRPKSSTVKMVEGCLLLVLFTVVVAAGCAILISLYNSWRYH